MFGNLGGESHETVARKRGYLVSARERWPYLTRFDLSVIKNPLQLAGVVRDRSGSTREEARHDVEAWMVGKDFDDHPGLDFGTLDDVDGHGGRPGIDPASTLGGGESSGATVSGGLPAGAAQSSMNEAIDRWSGEGGADRSDAALPRADSILYYLNIRTPDRFYEDPEGDKYFDLEAARSAARAKAGALIAEGERLHEKRKFWRIEVVDREFNMIETIDFAEFID